MAIALSGSLILSGSIIVSGSITSTGTVIMSGSIASASYALNATTGAYANTSTSASYALNATLHNGLASSIFATTGSNNFTAVQHIADTTNPTGFDSTGSLYSEGGLHLKKDAYISSSLYIKGNLTVYGTQSVSYITSSQLNISTNIITVNTSTPSIRFGGLAVQDSGSAGGLTGSLLWDSQNNSWLYNNPSGSGNYDSSLVIMGPRNSSTLGNEVGLSCNYLVQGHGHHHTTSSAIFHDGTNTCIPNTLIGGTICSTGNTCFGGMSIINNCLGIGTATPQHKLDIQNGNLGIYYNTNVGGCASGAQIYLGDSNFQGGAYACSAPGIGAVYAPSTLVAGDLAFFTYTGIAACRTERMRIAGGNVGIGCTTPSYPLDVKGTAGTIARITDGTSHITFYAGSGLNEIATVSPMLLSVNGAEALRINTGKQFIVGATSMAYANCIGYVAGFMSDFTGQSVVSIARKGQTLASQGMFIGIDSTSSYFWNRDNVAIQLGTNDTTKMTIACTGQVTFACSVCAPQYITTQGSSVSYATGTDYTVWNSEVESCIQDNNNPAAYTRIKTWIADRSGCATIRFTGYIVSGPTYWGYRVTRNGTSSYMCVSYSDCGQPGCASPYVHSYSSYQFNVGPFLPGDCIGLDVASTGGGATPSPGQGQYILAKEFRVFSSTPNVAAGTAGNVFGEWVGIGTCTPFSNLYIQGNNPAIYDSSVDNGQDGCGVTLTVRNNSTVTNSFAQLNMQVSGDSGRAVGRIVTMRKDSASSHMAFVIETANTKTEIMRMGCYSSHNFLMIGRTNAGISAASSGVTINATTGQIESTVSGDDILNLNRNVSDGKIIRLFKNCLEVGSISTNTYSLPSDINFKRNIDNLDLGLNLVTKLRPVSYNYKVDDCGSALSTGFIAQEMECSLSELGIEKNKYYILQHAPVEDPKESQYSLDYTKMIPVLTKAIQEQQCTINTLKTCLGIN